MVKEIKNLPSLIGVTPINNNVSQAPITAINNNVSDLEQYINLIEKALDLFVKFQQFMPNKNNQEQVQIKPFYAPELEVKKDDGVGKMDINIEFIVSILEQIDTMQKGITVREVIDFIKNNRETVEKLIEINKGKSI